MASDLANIVTLIRTLEFPPFLMDVFPDVLDPLTSRFNVQEGFVLDFKDDVPISFNSGFGAGICRLILAFHNTYGGLIVFGVENSGFTCVGTKNELDIEALNRFVQDLTGRHIECLMKTYSLESPERRIQTLLVPRRQRIRPAVLLRTLDKHDVGTTFVRKPA